jgi:hypothetical protein
MKRLALIVLLPCIPALARDGSRPELNSWFDHLASRKGLCCSFADGMALSDVDWESREGHYRVRLDNAWIDVPDDAAITEPGRQDDDLADEESAWDLDPLLHARQHDVARFGGNVGLSQSPPLR